MKIPIFVLGLLIGIFIGLLLMGLLVLICIKPISEEGKQRLKEREEDLLGK